MCGEKYLIIKKMMPFNNFLLRCIKCYFSPTPKYDECLAKKKQILEQIETKLDVGLDRALNAILGWVKIYLQNEQKKTDFKPETDDFDTIASPVSNSVLNKLWNIKITYIFCRPV